METPPVDDPPLDALRQEIDEIDTAIHDLLMRRMAAASRISETKRGAGVTGALIRPAREALILRRLAERHHGAFPLSVVVRIWREIISATLVVDGRFAVSVFAPEPSEEGLAYMDLARAHFGAETPLVTARTESGVLRAVRDGKAAVGVVPAPSDAMSGDIGVSAQPWWLTLAVGGDARPRIIARLPWLDDPAAQSRKPIALVVAKIAPEESGDDISFLALESPDTISRDRIRSVLAEHGLIMTRSVVWQDDDTPQRWQLIEIEGFVVDGDPRLGHFGEEIGSDIGRLVTLGSIAAPPPVARD